MTREQLEPLAEGWRQAVSAWAALEARYQTTRRDEDWSAARTARKVMDEARRLYDAALKASLRRAA